jgi:hypothetical protein
MGLEIGGHSAEPDWPKLGPSLVIATCLIVAIRTAKRPPVAAEHSSDPELDREIDFAAYVAGRVLAVLVGKKSGLFPARRSAWYQPNGDDSPK